MRRINQTVTAVIISGGLGLAAQVVFAQSVPGSSPSGPTAGPGAPQTDPTMPRETQPTIPGQPAPGLPGQSAPVPGQPGTIPERVQPPANQGAMNASPDDIKKAQEALTANGHNPGSTSGTMDSKTQQALRDFQKANKLPVTGMLDPETAKKLGITLGKDSGSGIQPGQDNTLSPKSGGAMPNKPNSSSSVH
jgi:putative peptidoglycan binding protein